MGTDTRRPRLSIDISGALLEYAWVGPDDAQDATIVFLHEGLGSLGQWRDFPEALCTRIGCRGVVYSRKGHGKSSPLSGPLTARFMHDEALVLLPQLLDRIGITKPILFGHSDGGSIALIYAGAGYADVAGLILEAPHVFVEDLTIRGIRSACQRYESGDLKTRLGRHHDAAEALFTAWTDIWLSPDFRGWNIEQYAESIDTPVLLIQGCDDEYGTEAQLEAITAKVRGHCRSVLLPQCGHFAHADQRDAVARVAAEFVEAVIVRKAVDHSARP
jgi:pimeloyl-ACP methyl ester carboxylesterase